MAKIEDLIFSGDSDHVVLDCKVEKSPHYEYVVGYMKNDEKMKTRYILWHMARSKNVSEKIYKFNQIIKSAIDKGIKKPIKVKNNRILDGHHRAAIALALGKKEIKCQEQ